MIQEGLLEMPHHICTSHTVAEAMTFLQDKNEETALILTDYKMPEMTGLDFRKQVIEKWPDIPFAVLSSYVSRKMAMDGIDLKVSAYFEKEINPLVLRESIEKLIADRIAHLESEKEIRDVYLEESADMINEMEDILLSMETGEATPVNINSMFRLAHTVKGGSGFLNNQVLSDFLHHFEDILSKMKNGTLSFSGHIVSVLLKALDELKKIFSSYTQGLTPEMNPDYLNSILDLGQINPAGDSGPSLDQDKELKGKAESDQSSSAARQSIDVPVELLDSFIEKSGDLVVKKNMISKIIGSLESRYPLDRDVQFLDEVIEETHKIIGNIQKNISDLRKSPLSSLIRYLKRQSREISVSTGKKVNFVISGDSIRVDNKIAEVLNKTMIHILRNSMDHGMESSEDRIRSGKPEEGVLSVDFRESDDALEVIFSDDGKGIDHQMIRQKIVEKNLIPSSDAEKLSSDDVIQFIFHPGFSTAASITSISGRGVGMDMVKTSVEEIGGKILIETMIGKGTTFHFVLPKPKAVNIIDSIGVQAGGLIIQIDNEEIDRIIDMNHDLQKNMTSSVGGSPLLEVDQDLIPLIKISETFMSETSHSESSGYVVILKTAESHYGIMVDQILNNENIVVSKMPDYVNRSGMYKGSTILGDGSIAIVLNTDGFADKMDIKNEKNKEVRQKYEQSSYTHGFDAESRQILLIKDLHGFSTGIELDRIARLVSIRVRDLILIKDDYYFIVNHRQYMGLDIFNVIKYMKPDDVVFSVLLKSELCVYGIFVNSLSEVVSSYRDIETECYDRTLFKCVAELERGMCLVFDVNHLFNIYSYKKQKIKFLSS